MSYETPPQAPFLNVHRGTLTGPIAFFDDGGTNRVYLTKAILGWNPQAYPVILIQCEEAASTVEVLALDGTTWCTYPGASATVAADKIKVLRGRWLAIRIATAGNVWVKGDLDDTAYNSSL